MLTNLLEFVFCAGVPCGAPCTRWGKPTRSGDTGVWRDLSLLNYVPSPRKPAVPQVVRFPLCQYDDISALNEGSLLQSRNEYCNPSEEKVPDDLELRVESVDYEEEEESTDVEVELRFFAELYSTPLTKCRSQASLLDGDGSSYSTRPQQASSFQTDSTDATMQTKNTLVPNLPNRAPAMF